MFAECLLWCSGLGTLRDTIRIGGIDGCRVRVRDVVTIDEGVGGREAGVGRVRLIVVVVFRAHDMLRERACWKCRWTGIMP